MNALLKRIASSLRTWSTLLFVAVLIALVVPIAHRSLDDAQALMRDAMQTQLDAASQMGRLLLKVDDVIDVRNMIWYGTPEYEGLVGALSTLQRAFAVDRAQLIRRIPGGAFVYVADARHSVGIDQPVDLQRRFPGGAQALVTAWERDRPIPATWVGGAGPGRFRAVTPLRKGTHVVALLVLERSAAPLEAALAQRRHDLWLGAMLALLGGAFLWWLFIVRSLRPLGALQRAVQAIAAGEGAALPKAQGSSAVAALVRSVGELVDDLQAHRDSNAAEARTLEEREAEATRDLAEVLDVMGEGLLTLDARGCVAGPCSAAAQRLLGPLDAGADAIAQLAQDEPTRRALREALAQATSPASGTEESEPVSPPSAPMPADVRGPQGRRLQLRLGPVTAPDGDREGTVRLVFTDLAERDALEAALARCRGEQVSLVRVLAWRDDYEACHAEALAAIDAGEREVQAMELVRRSVVDALLLALRSLACGAERFALVDAQARAEALEGLLHDLGARRDEVCTRADRARLLEGFSALRESLGREVAALRTGMGAPAPGPSLVPGGARLERIIGDALAAVPQATREPLRSVLQRLHRVPAGALLRSYGALVKAHAERMGRPVAFTVRSDAEAALPPERLRALAPTLLQLIRNALVHGLEDDATRRQAGKAPRASLTCTARAREAGVVFTIEDDGRGIDLGAVRAAAAAGGFVAPAQAPALGREALLSLLFLPGFSLAAAPGAQPGAGVGLQLVHNDVERLHGRVRLVTRRGHGTTVQIYCPLAG